MVIVKVWCLPDASEDKLNRLHQAIVKAVVSVSEIGVKNQNDMICLFPADLMKYGLGEEIIIEIDGIVFDTPRRAGEKLVQFVGKSVSVFYPDARIECFVGDPKPSHRCWSSKTDERR